MAEPYAFCSMPHSQPSSPPGARVKDANENDFQQFRETELFEYTLVLQSPLIETQNTELVDDSDPTDNLTSGPIFDHQLEVVLDSEDEEMHSEAITVAKGLHDDKSNASVKNSSLGFRKRHRKPPSEQAEERAAGSNATSFGKSATGLNDIRSQEPGDTQAALGFVDQYLSSNNVDLFQGIHHRKSGREKSPHVPHARGSLSLAKKIKAHTKNEGKEPFQWLDSDQNDKGFIFGNRIEASSNFGSHRQTYVRRRQKKGGHLPNPGNCSTGNGCGEMLVQGPGMATENNNPVKELDVQSSAIRENINAYSSVAHTEVMCDIGLDTQMAAEAMETLACDYVPLPGCHSIDAQQLDKAFDGSVSDVTYNKAHLQNSSYRKNLGLQSITEKSKKRNVSSCSFSKVTSSSSRKHSENQGPDTFSGKMKNLRESQSTIEGQFDNNSLPIRSEHVSLEEVCPQGECMSFQHATKETQNSNSESRRTKFKDQPTNRTERNSNLKEKGVTKYKRNVNGLVAKTLKLGAETKRIKLPNNSSVVARNSRLNHQVRVFPWLSETSSFLGIDSWLYPKRPRGKRKRANVQINFNAPPILCTQSVIVNGKESSVYSSRILERQNDVEESCFPHTGKSSCIDIRKCMLQGNSVQQCSVQFENQNIAHPLLLAHVEISSTKSVAQSNSEIPATVTSRGGIKSSNAHQRYNEHRKNSCAKNLPRSSFLKELIRLGVSGSTSDLIWKDLRQRREMTYVRVLFSQHLDDTVIKQQKKILARLNISIASSSMEATHFVADKFTRTRNMLETMALGKLVVTHLWLESCGQANCFIDEKNYILRDVKKEKEIGFSMPVSLARARQKPLLKGKRVCITQHVKPDKEVVASLVKAVHGQVVDESQMYADKNDKILDDLLILSCEDDYEICRHFLERGAAVYSAELLLNGIVIQKLELERHQLYMNQVTRNKASASNRFGKVYRRQRPVSGPQLIFRQYSGLR